MRKCPDASGAGHFSILTVGLSILILKIYGYFYLYYFRDFFF